MIKKLGIYIGVTTGIVSLATLIFTAGQKHERKIVADTSVASKVERLVITDSIRNVQMVFFQEAVMDSISNISHQLRRQRAEFQETKTSLENLRMYMIGNAATKEDMVNVLNVWDVKKNLILSGTARQ